MMTNTNQRRSAAAPERPDAVAEPPANSAEATAARPAGEEQSDDADATDSARDDVDLDHDPDVIDDARSETPRRRRGLRTRLAMTPIRAATLTGITALVAVAAVLGWLVVGLHREHVADERYDLYLQTGRQGALNLTTIDWQHVDADVQRVLDSATGTFYDDFNTRAKDFTDVVKQTQSHTEGTIVDAAVETETPTGAQVIVAVNVKTTQAGQPEQRARGWRMRILVERFQDTAKIANVEFVP